MPEISRASFHFWFNLFSHHYYQLIAIWKLDEQWNSNMLWRWKVLFVEPTRLPFVQKHRFNHSNLTNILPQYSFAFCLFCLLTNSANSFLLKTSFRSKVLRKKVWGTINFNRSWSRATTNYLICFKMKFQYLTLAWNFFYARQYQFATQIQKTRRDILPAKSFETQNRSSF